MSRGHTLFELTVALTLLAMMTTIAASPLRRYRDAAAVAATREAVAGLIVRTRAMAVASGGASLHLQADPPGAWLVVNGDTVETLPPVPERIVIDLGRRDSLTLAYDEVGLGRIASATIRFERGEERRELIVASFGRLRRR